MPKVLNEKNAFFLQKSHSWGEKISIFIFFLLFISFVATFSHQKNKECWKKNLWHKRYFWFFCEMRQDMLDVTYLTKRIISIKFYVLSWNLLWKPIVIPNLSICRVTEKIMKNKRFVYLNWSVWRIIFVAIRNIKLANVIIGLLTEALVTLAQMWHCTLFKCLWFEF